MYVLDCIFKLCCVQDTILVIPPYPTALRREKKILRWKTVGMLVSSFSLHATCVQQVGDPQRMHPTDAALITSITTWSSSAPLRS